MKCSDYRNFQLACISNPIKHKAKVSVALPAAGRGASNLHMREYLREVTSDSFPSIATLLG